MMLLAVRFFSIYYRDRVKTGLTNNNNSKPFTACFPQWIGQDRSICTLYITMEDSNGLHSRY
jgi:hypothetical protein